MKERLINGDIQANKPRNKDPSLLHATLHIQKKQPWFGKEVTAVCLNHFTDSSQHLSSSIVFTKSICDSIRRIINMISTLHYRCVFQKERKKINSKDPSRIWNWIKEMNNETSNENEKIIELLRRTWLPKSSSLFCISRTYCIDLDKFVLTEKKNLSASRSWSLLASDQADRLHLLTT